MERKIVRITVANRLHKPQDRLNKFDLVCGEERRKSFILVLLVQLFELSTYKYLGRSSRILHIGKTNIETC